MTPVRAEAAKNISGVTERKSLEFPSLAPDESKLSPASSLGNIVPCGHKTIPPL